MSKTLYLILVVTRGYEDEPIAHGVYNTYFEAIDARCAELEDQMTRERRSDNRLPELTEAFWGKEMVVHGPNTWVIKEVTYHNES